MQKRRSGSTGMFAGLWIGCSLFAFATGAARAADEAAADSSGAVPGGLSYSVEATTSYHYVNTAYFGADWGIPVPRGHAPSNFSWGEGFTRLRFNYGLPQGVWLSVGGALMATVSTDYYGVDGTHDGLLDQLLIGASHIGGTGLSVVAGRQDLQVGDGFLIGDGYRDSRAALWNIPLNFYDAVRVDLEQGPWHALAFGSHLSHSLSQEFQGMEDARVALTLRPDGNQYGGEVGWGAGEDRSLAIGYFQRVDDGTTALDARAFSVRGAVGARGLTLAGEVVAESGTESGMDLKGRGGHVGLKYALERKGDPYAQVEYFHFSGDDPATPAHEQYYPWNYRWTDWSRYYVADLVASTLVTNTDSRIWKLEAGCAPLENTGLRLLLHRISLDTGAGESDGLGWYRLPEGVGRGFADEADLVVDQAIGEHWSAWVMGGYARPLDAARFLVGGASSGQLFVSLTYKFDGAGGSGD
jgi:hypothetical protein